MTTSHSLPKQKIKALLLGGIHHRAKDVFKDHGYDSIKILDKELSHDALIAAVRDVHFLGIRSATQITEAVLDAAPKLISIGCFCIGTNQVDLVACKKRGIAVFNSPFGNTRSVAELVIAEVIMLLRGIPEKNVAAHAGRWMKTAKGSTECRGKTLGIIGYGHIGTQVGVLAEALGMRVIAYDIVPKLMLGNAMMMPTKDALLKEADVVTLHVPGGKETKNLIGAGELRAMKPGSRIINAARGQIIDTAALKEALESGHIAGAAIDVHPEEPVSKDDRFISPLQGLQNVILTPHIAGSTMEAQGRIGEEVAERLISFSDTGSTLGSVNLPELSLPLQAGCHRLLHIHRNEPGLLASINEVFAKHQVNIAGQFLKTDTVVGYVVTDIERPCSKDVIASLKNIPGTIRTRTLY